MNNSLENNENKAISLEVIAPVNLETAGESSQATERDVAGFSFTQQSSQDLADEDSLSIEKNVTIEKANGEFGFRIHGSKPVVVSAVERGTEAERCGLEIGDVIVTINDVNVLDFTHSDVVRLAHSGCLSLRLVPFAVVASHEFVKVGSKMVRGRQYPWGVVQDGGVHIVGGRNGDAFIAFSNDEDARQAMAREGGLIKESRVKLFLSSRNEMLQVIEKARTQNLGVKTNQPSLLGIGPSISMKTPDECLQNSNDKGNNQASLLNFSNENSSLANLQETPDYRRHRSRSPIDRLRDRSNSPYSKQRVNQLLEQVRCLNTLSSVKPLQISEIASSSFNPNSSVRSRLGGFDLPLPINAAPNKLELNRWNLTNNNPPILSGLLMPPQNRYLSSANNNFYDNQISFIDPLISNNEISNPNLNSSNTMINQKFNQRCTLELRGLPYGILPADIQAFFRPVGLIIEREQIKILLDDRGMPNGIAYLQLTNDKSLESALLLNGRCMGNNRIEVIPIFFENEPLLNSIQPNLSLIDSVNDYSSTNVYSSVRVFDETRKKNYFSMFMKGIPYNSCNEEDVAKFFDPINVYEVVVISERKGRPSGNAYVLFENKEDFDLAMKRNKKYMGSRYIELFPVRKEEVEKYKSRNSDRFSYSSRKRRRSLERQQEDNTTNFCIQIKGLPPTVNNRDLTNYFMMFGAQASAIHIMLKADGMNAGEAFVEFWSRDFLEKALRQNGEKMGNYRLSIKEVSYSKVCDIVGLQPLKSKHAKSSSVNSERSYSQNKYCTLVASNIPFRAKIGDICAFFQDFDVRRSQVEQKLDRNGLPTDEALIHFRSPEEADKALRTMNRKYLIGKLIYLKHV
ncbi:hypothetical protein RND71_043525 [Anisodus tanguticus]|uniref:Uncharacterized protein n=1 Tax=Anisodus tanguticus TaxID=243964 RepID=A0AAE1UM37_9SOLA|nr:hypothetical protein RND71_043525 [Anisodus tanguticus]